MYTRFTCESGEYVMRQTGSMGPIGPDVPGADFLKCLGAAYQERHSVLRLRLLRSAHPLLEYLSEDRDLLAFRYAFSIPAKGQRSGSGSTSGFKVEGCECAIEAGVGKCNLRRIERNEEGTVTAVETVDVRRKKKIATDDWGDIRIARRKIEFTFPDALAECIDFLESIPDNSLELFSYDQPPTLREILREFDEGSGGRDWAIEEICGGGEKSRDELLVALKNNRLTKHRATIAQLLLICFPGEATRSTILESVDKMKGKSRSELLTLIAAYSE